MKRLLILAATLAPLPAAAAEGMPQLDFANPLTVSQVVWMAVILAVLYILLSQWALPQVEQVLVSREAAINADLEASRTAKTRADAAASELTAATAKSRAEAQASVNAAEATAKAEAAARAAEQNERLERQLAEAEQRIGQARASAMGALRQVATETAVDIVGRLTSHAADPGAVDRAVGSALGARGLG
jgi:F-type H+-transporting ATPase subunit b